MISAVQLNDYFPSFPQLLNEETIRKAAKIAALGTAILAGAAVAYASPVVWLETIACTFLGTTLLSPLVFHLLPPKMAATVTITAYVAFSTLLIGGVSLYTSLAFLNACSLIAQGNVCGSLFGLWMTSTSIGYLFPHCLTFFNATTRCDLYHYLEKLAKNIQTKNFDLTFVGALNPIANLLFTGEQLFEEVKQSSHSLFKLPAFLVWGNFKTYLISSIESCDLSDTLNQIDEILSLNARTEESVKCRAASLFYSAELQWAAADEPLKESTLFRICQARTSLKGAGYHTTSYLINKEDYRDRILDHITRLEIKALQLLNEKFNIEESRNRMLDNVSQSEIKTKYKHTDPAILSVLNESRMWLAFVDTFNVLESDPKHTLLEVIQRRLNSEVFNKLIVIHRRNSRTPTTPIPTQTVANDDYVTAIHHLSANCGFKENDYIHDLEPVAERLGVSLQDLDETLEKIGLKSDEDLFTNNIVPRPGTGVTQTKKMIEENLYRYIDHKVPPPPVFDTSKFNFNTHRITEIAFQYFKIALAFLPATLSPEATALGFVAGLASNHIVHLYPSFPNLSAIVVLSNPIFCLGQSQKRALSQFANGTLFSRCRSISYELTEAGFYQLIGAVISPVLYAAYRGFSIGDDAAEALRQHWRNADPTPMAAQPLAT